MATTIIYGDTNDDALLVDNNPWSASRDGLGNTPQGGQLLTFNSLIPGQYRSCQSGVRFDTSVFSGQTITNAVLNLEAQGVDNLSGRSVDAYIYDFGATITDSDWRTLAHISGGLPRVASRLLTGVVADTRYDFTDIALPANINKTGFTYIWLTGEETRTDIAPTTNHFIGWKNSDTAGTADDPMITVTTADPATRSTTRLRSRGRGRFGNTSAQ